ncbi:sulfonate ABC transporter substrate-binding protein [soil metagenome]
MFDRRSLLSATPALLLAACSGGSAPGRKVRIGFQRDGVLLLAQSNGWLEKELKAVGVQSVEYVLFPSGPPLLEAMRAGAVDFGSTGETPPIFAQAGGSSLVYAAAQPVTGAGQALITPDGSPIRKVADLRGKTLAFTPGSSAHLFALEALRGAGLTLADVNVAPLSPPDASAAFARGALDGWIIWDSYLALAERDLKARRVIDGNALPPTSTFFLAARSFAEGSPTVLSALLSKLSLVARQGEADVDRAVKIIAAASGLSPEIVRISRRRGPMSVTPLTDQIIARQQAVADVLSEARVIPRKIQVAEAAWRGWKGDA